MRCARVASIATLVMLLVCTFSGSLDAQQRPSLPAGADANDWEAYYDYGIARLRSDARGAEAAFAWSSKLDPTRAEPLFAQFVMFWLRKEPDRFQKYLRDDRKMARDPEVLRADSLRQRALHRNPFVHQGLTIVLYDRLPGYWGEDSATRGWIAYAQGELPMALQHFARAIERDPKKYGTLRFTRASAFVNRAQYDSAFGQMTELLAQLRASDEKVLGDGYQSKELLEYAIGRLHAQRNQVGAARDAFGRALSENAAFAPAHEILGRLALARRDSAAALFEFGAGLELDPSDPAQRLGLAEAMLLARRPAEAIPLLRELLQQAPLWAEPLYQLGLAQEAAGDRSGAIAAYETYLERASRNAPWRSASRSRLRALGASPAP